MIKIGLVGNIASGKSTAEEILADMGIKVVDLDIISHRLLETSCKNDVLREFSTLDRKKIASVVFNDKGKLKKLENIIHPKLKEFVKEFFDENKNEKMVVVSGALLLEAGFRDLFDKIILIEADKNLRYKRLMKRNNYSKNEAEARIQAQNDIDKNLVDFVAENNKNKKALSDSIKEIIDKIKS